MSHTIFTGGAVDKLEEVLKELTKRIKVLEDSVTTIEECDISEWNTPTKLQRIAKNYLLEGGATHSWKTGAKIVKE